MASSSLYTVFARYRSAGREFCRLCTSREDDEYLRRSTVPEIDAERARQLLWEAADHWESAEVYRHFLPRILTALAPPELIEPIYPAHVSETLLALGFAKWPSPERIAVLEHLRSLQSHFDERAEDALEWAAGIRRLEASGEQSRADA